MALPISPLIDLSNGLICGICGFIMYRSYRQDRRRVVLQYFSYAYFSLIVSYLFFSIPRIIAPTDSTMIGIGFVVAQAFLYLTVAHFSKVTTYFINVQWVRRIFWLVILISVITVFLMIINFPNPVYNTGTGITDWDIAPVVGIASSIILIGVLAPSALFFLQQGLRSSDKIVKRRSITISIGLIFLIVTAYTYYSATTQLAVMSSDVISLASFLIIFFGVIYKRGKENNNPVNITN